MGRSASYEIENEGQASTDYLPKEDTTIDEATIIGIVKFVVLLTCVNCASKIEYPRNAKVVTCNKCNMMQGIESSSRQMSGQFLIKDETTDDKAIISATNTVLNELCILVKATINNFEAKVLLSNKKFKVSYSAEHILSSIEFTAK